MAKEKILVVDDDDEILFAMSAICEFKGWIPITAANIEEALEKFKLNNPDIILMDYHLPKVSGIEGVKLLRNISSEVPIIVLTIEENQEVANKFFESGASDFALKPIKAPDIISRINVHLKFKQSMKNLHKNLVTDYSKGINPETLEIVENYFVDENKYVTIDTVSKGTGLAYQTVHRYIQYLLENNKIETKCNYGKKGRPKQEYIWIA